MKAYLIEAAGAGVHFYTECGNSSAVKDVYSRNKKANVRFRRNDKAIVHFE